MGAALGNGGDGVRIDTLALHDTVGGTATGAGNLISSNTRLNAYGLHIDGVADVIGNAGLATPFAVVAPAYLSVLTA